MFSLYLEGIRLEAETTKAANPKHLIDGALVYFSTFLEPLLRYSSVDYCYLPNTSFTKSEAFLSSPTYQGHADRIRVVSLRDLACLRTIPSLVLMSLSYQLRSLAWMRHFYELSRCPIVGVLHSTNHPIEQTFLDLCSPLFPYDTLLCSSSAGKRAFANRLSSLLLQPGICEALKGRSVMQLCQIPLAIHTQAFDCEITGEEHRIRHALGIPSDSLVILYVGRFHYFRKCDLRPLIVAFGRLQHIVPKAVLILAGDDVAFGMADSLRAFGARFVDPRHVRVVPDPSLPYKLALYHTADIFVSPSENLAETFGLTLLEAMAAGLPIVASDWDGYRDLVVDGETGLLVRTCLPRYDSSVQTALRSFPSLMDVLVSSTTIVDLDSLVEALARLAQNDGLRKQMGENGRRRVRRHYDWKVVIPQYEGLWLELISEAATMHHTLTDGTASNLHSYPYENVNHHYSSDILVDTTSVAMSNGGGEILEQDWLLDEIAQPRGWIERDVLRQITGSLRGKGATTIREVVAMMSPLCRGVDRSVIFMGVARLLKYGVLRFAELPNAGVTIDEGNDQ
jgi:D-inositol-3-phosphate glycosyltransferase